LIDQKGATPMSRAPSFFDTVNIYFLNALHKVATTYLELGIFP